MSKLYLIVAAFFVSQSMRCDAASSAPSECPNSEICTCTPKIIECICTNGDEDIHFRRLQASAHDLRSVSVQNCRNVYVNEKRVFTKSGRLERLRFSNLQSLHFGMFSLERSRQTSSLKEVIIENVKNVTIGDGAMNSFQKLDLFELSNSHFAQLNRGVISISYTSRIIISDCTFGTISKNSLVVVKAEAFQMIKTSVNTIESLAIVLRDINDTLYHSNHFGRLEAGEPAFSIYGAKSVTFDNCTFDEISMKAFHGINGVKEFFFQNNIVKHFQGGTFHALGVSDRVVFANNRIYEADVDSLLPNKYLPNANTYFKPGTTALEVRDNLFVCDRRLQWLWEDPDYYKILLETSKCFKPEDVNGKILSSLSVDDYSKEPVNETTIAPPEELREDDLVPSESDDKSTAEEDVEEQASFASSFRAGVVGCLVSILISSIFIKK